MLKINRPNSSSSTSNVGRLFGYILCVALLFAVMSVDMICSAGKVLDDNDGIIITAPGIGHRLHGPTRSSTETKPRLERRAQSLSVVQDVDALADRLRVANHRRRVNSAIEFFNAMLKRNGARINLMAESDGRAIRRNRSSLSTSKSASQNEL